MGDPGEPPLFLDQTGPKRNFLETPPPPPLPLSGQVSIRHWYFLSTFCLIIPNIFTSCWSSHVVRQLAISPDTGKKFWRLPLFTIYLSLQGLFRNFDDTFFDLLKPHLERLCIDAQVSWSWLDISWMVSYRKIPKISPGAYISERPFLKGLFLEGLIYGGKFAFQNRLG